MNLDLPKTQNETLRLIDISIIAWIAALFCALPLAFTTGWISLVITGCIAGEIIIGGVGYFAALVAKKRLLKAGQWRKLSIKELFNLHEWRNGV